LQLIELIDGDPHAPKVRAEFSSASSENLAILADFWVLGVGIFGSRLLDLVGMLVEDVLESSGEIVCKH